jgi:hypothetical protein
MTRRNFAVAVGAAVSGISASIAAGTASAQDKKEKHVCKGMNACKGQGGCATSAKHDCKGHNACKGLGGCKTGDNGCAGKNSCKGKGGCAVPLMNKKSSLRRRRTRVA